MSKTRAAADRLLRLFDQWKSEGQTDVLFCVPCCSDAFAVQVWLALHGRAPISRKALRNWPILDDSGRPFHMPLRNGHFSPEDSDHLLSALGEIPLGRLIHDYPETYLRLCLRYAAFDRNEPQERVPRFRELMRSWGIDRTSLAVLRGIAPSLEFQGAIAGHETPTGPLRPDSQSR